MTRLPQVSHRATILHIRKVGDADGVKHIGEGVPETLLSLKFEL